jgi:hypothetical protein
MMTLIFWVLAPCRLVGRRQCFGETYCLYIFAFMILCLQNEVRNPKPKQNLQVIIGKIKRYS